MSPTEPLSPSSPVTAEATTWQIARLAGWQHPLDDVNVYACFRYQLRHLWKIWELMVLGRPLLIFTQTPAAASDCVLAALSLIAPLSYAGDARPFFTLQDPDFPRFEAFGKKAPDPAAAPTPAAVLGITNPFLVKQLAGWPNLIAVSRKPLLPVHRPRSGIFSLGRKVTPRDLLQDGFREVFTTSHRFALDDDSSAVRTALLALLPVGQGADPRVTDLVNNDTLRRHFLTLTDQFLQPLKRYFDEVWGSVQLPVLLHPDGWRAVYSPAAFLTDLQLRGFDGQLFKGPRQEAVGLYRAFLASPNFTLWLRETVAAAFRTELTARDLSSTLAACSEEQLVEVYTHLRAQGEAEQRRLIIDRPLVDRLLTATRHIRHTLLPPHVAAALPPTG